MNINFSIPQFIIDDLARQFDELDPTPWDERETVQASYDEDDWLIECSLTYSLDWHEETDGAGQSYDYYEAQPYNVVVDKCRLYHDAESDDYTDYSEQLYNQLIKEIDL